MPNSRPPIIYPTNPPSLYNTARAPRFIPPVAPLANPKMLSTNFGDSVANSGKIKASAKAKGNVSTKKRLNRR
jgi:hypothetical protein